MSAESDAIEGTFIPGFGFATDAYDWATSTPSGPQPDAQLPPSERNADGTPRTAWQNFQEDLALGTAVYIQRDPQAAAAVYDTDHGIDPNSDEGQAVQADAEAAKPSGNTGLIVAATVVGIALIAVLVRF